MSLEGLPLFQTAGKAKHLSVTELTARIRGHLEPVFADVWVQGEVSNYRPAPSGHAYFSLKDSGASIAAAYFGWGKRNGYTKGFDLKDGLQVVCHGRVTVYPPRGNYQLVLDKIEPLGAGQLQIAFEQLKAKLLAEGLFDSARKRALPTFPSRVAIVTSPSGAAIQDMLTILGRRAPQIRVTIIPALVQGTEASKQIVRGLELANRHGLGDLVVLARGGGSAEDLWCFNDELLARAIAASKLPVISAVGHEVDFTISDFVADLRAPTPSAAAEIVSGAWVESGRRVRELGQRLWVAMRRDVGNRKRLLEQVVARVISPRDRLREQAQRCDEWAIRLERAMLGILQQKKSILHKEAAKLDALSPLRVLNRGYSIVREVEGGVIKSAKQIYPGLPMRIRFSDGEAPVQGA